MPNGVMDDAGLPPRWLAPFGWFTLLFIIGAQVYAVMTSPPELNMGHLQKILYVHVPAAWVAGLAFLLVFIYSLLFLWKRQPRHDLVAASAAEVGTMLTALTIALGSIWARPTWGVWWTWDPRLTTTALVLMIFAGYLALRAFTDDEDQRGRWSAAVGILGFVCVPIVYMSVKWWRTIHQPQSTTESVDSPYAIGLLLNSLAFTALLVYLVASRYRVARLERAIQAREEEAALMGGPAHV
jgi:heme exporter protein C